MSKSGKKKKSQKVSKYRLTKKAKEADLDSLSSTVGCFIIYFNDRTLTKEELREILLDAMEYFKEEGKVKPLKRDPDFEIMSQDEDKMLQIFARHARMSKNLGRHFYKLIRDGWVEEV